MTKSNRGYLLGLVLMAALCAPKAAWAQADEIQVYDGGLADVGTFNLTLHNNFTPKGLRGQAFPGAVISDKSLNGVPEWAVGVRPWFEAGLYLPLYSRDKNTGWGLDGFKLRTLFAVPGGDDRKFVYGVGMEFSINAKQWDTTRFTSEIRPIFGWHLKPVDILINPILDTAYDGVKNLVFAPSVRVAYNFKSYALAIEEYADYGLVSDLAPRRDQSHQLFGVIDHTVKGFDIEAGVGVGLTRSSDKLTLKLILSKDLN